MSLLLVPQEYFWQYGVLAHCYRLLGPCTTRAQACIRLPVLSQIHPWWVFDSARAVFFMDRISWGSQVVEGIC